MFITSLKFLCWEPNHQYDGGGKKSQKVTIFSYKVLERRKPSLDTEPTAHLILDFLAPEVCDIYFFHYIAPILICCIRTKN